MTSRTTPWEPRRRARDNIPSGGSIKAPRKNRGTPTSFEGSQLYSYPLLTCPPTRTLRRYGPP